MTTPLPIKAAFHALREYCQEEGESPTLVKLHKEGASAFQILISTLISLRTKDNITLAASNRLFAKAATPEKMATLTEEEISELIFPAGFYKTKAKQILEISETLWKNFNSTVPNNQSELLKLPGVGNKTANLVLNLAFNIKAICVDTHVHRFSNRAGWVSTQTPEATEKELMKILPEEYWIEANELIVTFGQEVCTPAAPRCSACMFLSFCPKIGVMTVR